MSTSKRVLLVAGLLIAALAASGAGGAAAATPPEPPHRFFGTVTDGSGNAVGGATVEAIHNGTVVDSTTTDSDGYYDFEVSDGTLQSGETVKIVVKDASKSVTWRAGDSTEIDFSVTTEQQATEESTGGGGGGAIVGGDSTEPTTTTTTTTTATTTTATTTTTTATTTTTTTTTSTTTTTTTATPTTTTTETPTTTTTTTTTAGPGALQEWGGLSIGWPVGIFFLVVAVLVLYLAYRRVREDEEDFPPRL